MKKIILTIIGIIWAGASPAQIMHIYKTDGSIQNYDMSQVAHLSFGHDTTLTSDYHAQVFYDSSMLEYPAGILDSMKIVDDTTYGESFLAYYETPQYDGFWYLDTAGYDGFPIGHLDSICFMPAPLPLQLIDDSANVNVNMMYPLNHYGCFYDSGDVELAKTALWPENNMLYCSEPLIKIAIDDSANYIGDSTIFCPYSFSSPYLRIDRSGKRLLSIRLDSISIVNGLFTGWLREDSLTSGASFRFLDSSAISDIIDSGQYNSSAVYVPGTNNIIYYTYGSYSYTNPLPADAGYYLFDRSTGTKTMLLHHITRLGPSETVNGFDISPDGKKLLIPSCEAERMSRIIEYDMTTQKSDTLRVPFNTSSCRWCLWLRYNHDASKILYSCYPVGAFGGSPGDSSEVGIIDRATLAKTELNVNPDNRHAWTCVFPDWSPDESKIVFCTGYVWPDPQGSLNIGFLGILKKLE